MIASQARECKSIIKEYCGISTCHGGPINPKLSTYEEITSLVVPGNPEASKLWNLLTTNDLNKAMPPVNAVHEVAPGDKLKIYNWIKMELKLHLILQTSDQQLYALLQRDALLVIVTT